MNAFVYWSAQKLQSPAARDLMVACGLGGTLEPEVGFTCAGGRDGPETGKPGTTFGFQDSNITPGYKRAAQNWIQVPNTPLWVGYYRGNKPKPAELLKKDAIPGYATRLGDFEEWIAPQGQLVDVERGFNLALPTEGHMDPQTGEWALDRVQPPYAELQRIMTAWHMSKLNGGQLIPEGESVRFTYPDLVTGALRSLQTNYRISGPEAELLGIFKEEKFAVDVLDALIDLPGAMAVKKKLDAVI